MWTSREFEMDIVYCVGSQKTGVKCWYKICFFCDFNYTWWIIYLVVNGKNGDASTPKNGDANTSKNGNDMKMVLMPPNVSVVWQIKVCLIISQKKYWK